jgi:hypothetical protein
MNYRDQTLKSLLFFLEKCATRHEILRHEIEKIKQYLIVSGLNGVQVPLDKADCNSTEFISPLLSVSTLKKS